MTTKQPKLQTNPLTIKGFSLTQANKKDEEEANIAYYYYRFYGGTYELEVYFDVFTDVDVIFNGTATVRSILNTREEVSIYTYNKSYSNLKAPAKFGVNWSAKGTQPADEAKAYADMITVACDVAEQLNKVTGSVK